MIPIETTMGVVQGSHYIETYMDNGRYRVRSSLRTVNLLFNFFESIFNVSYDVSYNEVGNFENGSYSMFLGKLQRDQIDTVVYLVPYKVQNDAFTFADLILEATHVIYSFTKPALFEFTELIASLNIFDTKTIVLMLLSILSFMLLFKRTLISLIALFFHQNFPTVNFVSKRVQQITLIAFLLIIYEIITANFSTDMSVIRNPKRINNLQDIILQNIKPVFIKLTNTDELFEHSSNEMFKSIWNLNKVFNESRRVFDLKNSQLLSEWLQEGESGDVAALTSLGISYLFPGMMCSLFPHLTQSFVAERRGIHISPPFAKSLMALPVSNKMDGNKIKAYKFITTLTMETGIMKLFVREVLTDIIESFNTLSGNKYFCEHEICSGSDNRNPFVTLKVQHFHKVLIISGIIQVSSAVSLLLELTISKCRKLSRRVVAPNRISVR